MSFVSYAQNFEDVLLHRVFGGQGTGYYVDVGAYHPVVGSTTKAFYDRGWSGINVEPGSVFAELATARPRDVNLKMAVFDRCGEVAFIEDEGDRGTSHVAADENDHAIGQMVPCDTLEAIVRAHSRGRPVDFIKIDAEGAEAAIVRSTDWRRLRPRVLLLEATMPWSSAFSNQEWEPTLIEQGYVRAYFDGINCFYIPQEEAPALLQHFCVPVNVLDCAVHHDCDESRVALANERRETARLGSERDAIRITMEHETARLAAERDAIHAAMVQQTTRLTAERDAARSTMEQETAKLAAERDSIRASMEQEFARLAAEWDTARTAMEQAISRLATERDVVRNAMEDQQGVTARLAAECDALRNAANHGAGPAQQLEARRAFPDAMSSKPTAKRRTARAAALAAYKLVRPVIRPLAWRTRGFLTSSLVEQLQQINTRLTTLPASGSVISPQAYGTTDGAAAEMRRLAGEMERTLITLALERAPARELLSDIQPQAVPGQPVAAGSARHIKLRLPHGRTTEIEFTLGDLSVAASLQATDGDWEPHVRRYLETVVQPDWVCLDIGANLGAHTLSMAVLAHEGLVVAFEADSENFQLLSRNVDALPDRRAAIEPVHVALWDCRGTLVCGGADELAGCSFVADDMSNTVMVERRLRTVVNSHAINDTKLHLRMSEVLALPLDAWLEDSPLPRLNLIKMDVEGAEVRVLRGADATLRRHRPILVVEYNPACAEAYFGHSPDMLFHELEARFDSIGALEQDGRLTPIPNWAALQTRLAAGKGWEDLVCRSESPTPASV